MPVGNIGVLLARQTINCSPTRENSVESGGIKKGTDVRAHTLIFNKGRDAGLYS
jgi:hypothetical protein